jgi:isoquinoline 1-oxidoreductase beta subunit
MLDAEITFMFRSSAALETNCSIADVRTERATVWARLKSPIVAQADVAKAVGLPVDAGHREGGDPRRFLRAQAAR